MGDDALFHQKGTLKHGWNGYSELQTKSGKLWSNSTYPDGSRSDAPGFHAGVNDWAKWMLNGGPKEYKIGFQKDRDPAGARRHDGPTSLH